MTTQTNETPAKEPKAGSGRFCAYDNTLLRFIGKTLTSKAEVNQQDQVKAAKKADHDVEIREV